MPTDWRQNSESSLTDELEGVMRLARAVGVDDPGEADGLQPTRALDATHVDHRPAELLEQAGDGSFRIVVIAGDEHVRLATGQTRLIMTGLNDVEALDHVRVGNHALDANHQSGAPEGRSAMLMDSLSGTRGGASRWWG